MIEATLIFFVPDWYVRILNDINPNFSYGRPVLLLGLLVGFVVGGFLPDRLGLVQGLIGGLGVAVTVYHPYEPFRGQLWSGNVSNASNSRTELPHLRLPGWQKWTLGLFRILVWTSAFNTAAAPGNFG